MDAPTPGKRTCPKCGQSLAADALDGLCPGCLLGLNLADPTQLSGDGGSSARPAGFVPPPAGDLAPIFPQLDILELVGRGGMGAVYKARQKELDRCVALKILPPDIGRDPAFAGRFAREARALARLNHPNIVTLYEFGRAGAEGPFYFLMEFVDGVSLGHLLRGGRISAREALAIVPQICDALQYAHDQGVVHRDIKPENILLDRQGRVKVADFGLAKIVRSDDPAGPPGRSDPGAEVSQTGCVLGTPPYMAPEQRERPSEVDHRADIYSLGVVFYQMLTGELPKGDLEPPSKKVVVDVRLDEVVLRALEQKPELRYQQASEVKTMVETIVHSPADAAAGAPGATVKKSDMVRIIEILCNSTFTSPFAIRLANFSALGFLGFLASLGFLDPRLKPCFGFSGFFGLFGLIGFAVLVEVVARSRGKAASGRDAHRSPLQEPRERLTGSERRMHLMVGALSAVILVAIAVVFQARMQRRERVDPTGAGEMRAGTEVASADTTAARVAFGTVIERNFGGDVFPWTNCWALNLASGDVSIIDLQRPPPDATNSLAVAATGQPDYPLSLDRRMPSLRAAHVDLMQHMAASISDMLLAFDLHLIPLSTNDWNISAAEAAARLAPVAATVRDPAEEIITGEHVYLFATRDGARGILQIMRQTTRLRYKLILGGANATLGPGFGPTVVRDLVAAPYRGRQDVLDLDEGRTIPAPERLLHETNPRGMLDWMVSNRLDLIVNNTPTQDFLGLHLDDGFFVRTPPQWAFDSIDAGEVIRHQAKPGQLQYVMLPKSEINDRPVFLFQTREGGRGVLQIAGFAPDSETVKLRYKIARSTPPPEAEMKSGGAPPVPGHVPPSSPTR